LAGLAAVCFTVRALAQDDFDISDVGGFGGGREVRSQLTIHADGTCDFKSQTIEARSMAEQQVRMTERFMKMAEARESGDETTQPDVSSTNDTKPFTDDELSKKLAETMNARGEEDSDQKVVAEVKKDDVVIVAMRSFASIEDMLKVSYMVWGQSGMSFENIKFETDSNSLLQVTLTPQKGLERYLKTYRAQWKLTGAKTEFRLVFPGKVVSSGFPNLQTNATWVAVDAKDDKSLDALAKLYVTPTVITAESGGLKLDHPSESKNLWHAQDQSEPGSDLPITDAGPGFVAEAQSITTTTLHVFPDGEKYFQQSPVSTGAVVSVKLFAPKGRTLKSLSNPRVVSAVDNKGRSVVKETEDSDESSTSVTSVNSGGSEDAAAMAIELQLALPQPDAQSIEKLSAEVEALTVGTWKEITLTNLTANATNELDLSGILPGAKMTITKVSTKDNQFNLQATLKGPATVQGIDVRAKIPGNDQYNSFCSGLRSSTKAGVTTRSINVQGYGYGSTDNAASASPILIIRCPDDLMRQRVKFELKGLDLL